MEKYPDILNKIQKQYNKWKRGKEMKKKALLIVAACACFITGCGAEKSTENKMKITESLHSASGESVSCLASVFTTQDGLLHIFDPNQKSSIVLCNKSNCEHEPYDRKHKPGSYL